MSIFILLLLFLVPVLAFSQERYAACDLCGFCPPNNPPSNWPDCVQCIYPSANPLDPNTKDTLRIADQINNYPPTPATGKHYTIIGCFNTNLPDFRNPGAAASVSQGLLKLVFGVVGGIAFLYLMYGAFVVLTSQSEPDRLRHGKQIIFGSIIGLIFSLFSLFLVNLIASQILKIPGF